MTTQHDELDAAHLRGCPACAAAKRERIFAFLAGIEAEYELDSGRCAPTLRPPARRAA